jgi:hypothetical protein
MIPEMLSRKSSKFCSVSNIEPLTGLKSKPNGELRNSVAVTYAIFSPPTIT